MIFTCVWRSYGLLQRSPLEQKEFHSRISKKHPKVSVLLQFPLKKQVLTYTLWGTMTQFETEFCTQLFQRLSVPLPLTQKKKLMSTPWLLDVPFLNDTVKSFEFSDVFVQVTYDCYVAKTTPVRFAFEPAAEAAVCRSGATHYWPIQQGFCSDTTKPHISEIFGSYG